MPGTKRFPAIAATLTAMACLLAAAPAQAQDWSRMQELMEQARHQAKTGTVEVLRPGDVSAYGTQDETFVSVDAYAFQGAQPGDHLNDDGNGYRHLETSTSGYLGAPLSLPGGVSIDALSVNICSTTGALTLALYDANWGGQPIVLIQSMTTFSTGCVLYSAFPTGTLYANPQMHPLYLVIHWEGPTDGSLKFNAASVGYRRLVSPAPAVATFNDVATDNPFFQFVEALAASGITAGCGGGNYCPNAPLTRGQMAVFLSKALGLHWPD